MANPNIRFKKVASYPTSGVESGDVIFCTGDHTLYVATGATTKEAFYGGAVKNITKNTAGDKLTVTFMDGTADLTLDFSGFNTSLAALQESVTSLEGRVDDLEAASPVAGSDIDITEGTNAINVSLDEEITVMGVTVGNLANGAKISSGSSLTEILKKILMKTIDAKAQNPTTAVKITSGVTNGSTYEVGTSLSIALGHTYSDGKFVGAESAYSYNLAAGCAEGTTQYKYDGTNVDASFTKIVTEGTHTLGCTTAYGASTASPKKNNGDASSASIAAGTATSGNLSFYGKFYGYVGYSTKTAGAQFDSASIKALAAAKSWLNVDSSTTLLSGGATSDGNSIVIAVPAKYKLSGIQNSLGVSILENFDDAVTVSYTNGSTTTSYKVYVYPITSGAKVAYKNVVITKA